MPIRRVIDQGDSVSRLSERYGLAPDTIWEHPANAKLRSVRSRRDALLPADELVIPDLRAKRVSCPTGGRHRFRRLGVPMLFEIQLFDAYGQPRRQRPYSLDVDGVARQGTTDASGVLREFIPNAAQRGRLVIADELDEALLFGELDPIETLSGVQRRLTNLGFACMQDAGAPGANTTAALARFQHLCGMPATGALDDATREAVRACHDDPRHLRAVLARNPPPSLA
jgi:N-acetylmuramoyl-L-alanine amidase